MYRKRHAESAVKKLSEMFGAVLVAGPRQVGKTTMLRALTKNICYVTLDDMIGGLPRRNKAEHFSRIILRPFSWMKFKRRPFSLNRSNYILIATARKDSFICAVRSSSG